MRAWMVASCLVCLPVGAQPGGPAASVERGRSMVAVVDTAGLPWAGASIVCFHPGVQAYPDLVPQDIVEATSDERGRASVELRPGCGYLAWARQSLPDGTWRLSQVTRAAGGRPIRLAESGEARCNVRVPIAGLEAWGHEAPFRFFATSFFGWRQELTATDGVVEVPPLPTPIMTLTVYGRSGLLLGSDGVQIADSGWVTRPSAKEPKIDVPPPIDLEIRLKDEGGAPVAGARVLNCDHSGYGSPSTRLCDVGRSSSAGTFGLRVPGKLDAKSGEFFLHSTQRVLAEGFADRQVGAFGWTIDKCPATSLEDGVLCHEVVLQAGFTIRGRLLAAEKQPAAGTALLMHAMVRTRDQDQTSVGGPAPKLVVVTDSEGKFDVPGCDPAIPYSLWAHLDERSYATLAKSVPYRLQRRVCLLANTKANGAALELGDVRLDHLDRWSFHVLEPDGSASPCAMLWLEPSIGDTVSPEPAMLDPIGRGSVLAARGTLSRAAAGSDASFSCCELAERAPGEATVLRLAACVPIVGKAVDENGKAMSGVLVQLWSKGVVRGPHERLFSCWYHNWVRKSRVTGSVATDERGGFRFEVVPGFVYQVACRQTPGRLNVTVDADATEGAVVDLRLVLDSKLQWMRPPLAGR